MITMRPHTVQDVRRPSLSHRQGSQKLKSGDGKSTKHRPERARTPSSDDFVQNGLGVEGQQYTATRLRHFRTSGSKSFPKHYFFTNYQIMHNAIPNKPALQRLKRRQPIPRSYKNVFSEYHDMAKNGLIPSVNQKCAGLKLDGNSEYATGKKIFRGEQPSTIINNKKRDYLLKHHHSKPDLSYRWKWDQPPRVRSLKQMMHVNEKGNHSGRAGVVHSDTHPHVNSMKAIQSRWSKNFKQSQSHVRYHRKNVFDRERFIDAQASMHSIVHDYPYDAHDMRQIDPALLR